MTTALAKVTWTPQALNGKLIAAAGLAARDAQRVAQIRNPAPSRIGVRLGRDLIGTSYRLYGTGPLAHLFEGGTSPHEEFPLYNAANAIQSGTFDLSAGSKKHFQSINRRTTAFGKTGYGAQYAFKFRTTGDFVRGVIHHPGMDAKPFIHPAGMLFPALYRRRAVTALAGF